VNPAVPPYLAEVVATAMTRDRDKRYQTARAFVLAIREAGRRYEAERAGGISRTGGSAPPVVVSAAASKIDPEQTQPDTRAVSTWAAGGGAGLETLRTIPDRVPTALLAEPAPPVPTAPTVLISDTKSTNTSDRGGSWIAAAIARIRPRFLGRAVVAPLIPGVPGRPRRVIAGFGLAIVSVATFGVWMRSSRVSREGQSTPKDSNGVRVEGVAPAAAAASLENAGTLEKPAESPQASAAAASAERRAPSLSATEPAVPARHDEPAAGKAVMAADPVIAAAIAKPPSSEKTAAARAPSPPKREAIAVDRLPIDGPHDAKQVRTKAKPAPTAPASEFFRTMGDD